MDYQKHRQSQYLRPPEKVYESKKAAREEVCFRSLTTQLCILVPVFTTIWNSRQLDWVLLDYLSFCLLRHRLTPYYEQFCIFGGAPYIENLTRWILFLLIFGTGRVEAGCITLCFVPRPEEAALGGLLPALDAILTFPGSITFSVQPFLLVQINWLTLNQSKDKVGGGCRIGLFVQSRVEKGTSVRRGSW